MNIKARTVGRGQHGTARWATRGEIARTYAQVDFTPERWREGRDLPDKQGIVVGCKNRKHTTTALVDTGDVHAIMIGAAGVGKTAYWLYPCLEYALASGMSFLSTDTKGDVFRNYAGIAKDCYGYRVSVIDLRNPTKSDGFNLLHLVNKYADLYKQEGKEGQCFPSVPTIARQTKLSEATVHRAIKDLEKEGFLYVTGRQRPNGADSSNLYTLTDAEPGW